MAKKYQIIVILAAEIARVTRALQGQNLVSNESNCVYKKNPRTTKAAFKRKLQSIFLPDPLQNHFLVTLLQQPQRLHVAHGPTHQGIR